MYEVMPFDINVQSLERTLIDKVFAICDYFLRKEPLRNSRHIYDIYMILTKVELNELKELVQNVRADRKINKMCVSAKDNVSIPMILQEIVDTDFFKSDYEKTTENLLIKQVKYDKAILSLNKIIKSGLFD